MTTTDTIVDEAVTREDINGAATTATHCPYRQATLLQEALAPDKMRVAFFLGAGCPVSIRVDEGGATRPLIPDVSGLTKKVNETLGSSEQFKAPYSTVLGRLKTGKSLEPNIEEVLTFVRTLREVVGDTNHDGLKASVLDELEAEICKITTEVVHAKAPTGENPYHQLATWINAIRREHPVEIFTPNYDLLIEQALETRRVPYFDGFVGSDRTFFDQTSIEQDNLPARWARLWKIHGSINWWKTSEGNVERRWLSESGDRQMIYPSHLKYDQSRRMPYLTMLDRLRAFLGRGQAVLVTCGYSFADQHLNEVILQGLNANPTSICFGMLFGDRAAYPVATAEARKHANLNLLAADGAILGTTERDWHSKGDPENPLHRLAVTTGEMPGRTKAPSSQCKFILGDFKMLGNFLAQQLFYRDEMKGNPNGK